MRFLLELVTFPLRLRLEEAKFRFYLGLFKLVLACVVLVIVFVAIRALLSMQPVLVALAVAVVLGLCVFAAVQWLRRRNPTRRGGGSPGGVEPRG